MSRYVMPMTKDQVDTKDQEDEVEYGSKPTKSVTRQEESTKPDQQYSPIMTNQW
jgi:hypothetical protein